MDINELKKVALRGEDSRHQFKEDFHNGDSLAAEMVAFSNSHGGQIFIGISDRGELIGLAGKDIDRVNQLISNSASQHVRSPIAVQTENVVIAGNRVVIVVTISEGIDKPYFDHQGVIWLKSGADKRRINSKEELRRLFQEVDLIHADEVPTRAGLEAMNLQQLQTFLENVYRAKWPDTTLDQLTLLENMNLSSNSKLNLAGLLLFGLTPQLYKPQFVVKAVSFAGVHIADRYLDSEDFEGSLPTVFQGALLFIMRNLRKIQKQKSVNSTGDPEIPQIVFEELLVNALIHRDYFINAPVRLFIFEDRVEIINPGHLPNHLTIEKIQAGNSVQRNPILASFAAKGLLPYRGLGTGVRRALQDWPRIRFTNDREGCLFTTLIERSVRQISLSKRLLRKMDAPINAPINASINAPINVSLSELQVQILKVIKENSSISFDEIALKLKKDRSTIRRNIQQLRFWGALQRSGSKKKGYWVVVKSIG